MKAFFFGLVMYLMMNCLISMILTKKGSPVLRERKLENAYELAQNFISDIKGMSEQLRPLKDHLEKLKLSGIISIENSIDQISEETNKSGGSKKKTEGTKKN